MGAFVVNKQVSMNGEGIHFDIPFSSLLAVHQMSQPTLTLPSAIFDTDQLLVTTVTSENAPETNNGNEKSSNDAVGKSNSYTGSRRSSCSLTSANDGFIMVDLVISLSCILYKVTESSISKYIFSEKFD